MYLKASGKITWFRSDSIFWKQTTCYLREIYQQSKFETELKITYYKLNAYLNKIILTLKLYEVPNGFRTKKGFRINSLQYVKNLKMERLLSILSFGPWQQDPIT